MQQYPEGDGLEPGWAESFPLSKAAVLIAIRQTRWSLRADTLRAPSRQWPIAQFRMADVAKAMVPRVVEKRNLNEVVALLEMQIKSLTGHGHPDLTP
jgi:hypothetical protein